MIYESVDEARGGVGENGWRWGAGAEKSVRERTHRRMRVKKKLTDKRWHSDVKWELTSRMSSRSARSTCRSCVSVRVQFYMWGKWNKHHRWLQQKKQKNNNTEIVSNDKVVNVSYLNSRVGTVSGEEVSKVVEGAGKPPEDSVKVHRDESSIKGKVHVRWKWVKCRPWLLDSFD